MDDDKRERKKIPVWLQVLGVIVALGVIGNALGLNDELAPEAVPAADVPAESGTEVVEELTNPEEPPNSIAMWPEFPELLLEGTGDDVLVFDAPIETIAVAIVDGSNADSNIQIWSLGQNGERLDLLVNDIAPYVGTVLLEGYQQPVSAFEVTATGSWSVLIRDLNSLPAFTEGEPFAGEGDAVVLAAPTRGLTALGASSSGESNFQIWGYGERKDLLVNDIAPYSGTVRVAPGTELFTVSAEGPWVLELR